MNILQIKTSPISPLLISIILCTIFCLATKAHGQNDLDPIEFGNYRVLNSKILNEDRLLYVHLPHNYEASEESYPVIFQLYSHFTYNYYLPAISASNWMQSQGEAPGTIVVGVKNSQFRYRDLLPVDHNQANSQVSNFIKFFDDELIPFIQKNYRTNGFRILAGPQAGAAFGIYALAKKPDLFHGFFLTNPFWIAKARQTLLNTLDSALNANSYDRKFLMITYKDRLSEQENQYLDSLSQRLKQRSSIELVLNPLDPDADFTSPVDFMMGLKTLFKSYRFPSSDIPHELHVIEDYYRKQRKHFGFDIRIPELTLVFEGDKFVMQKEWKKAKAIFLKILELYPKSAMAFDRLGTVAYRQSNFKEAKEYYECFLKQYPNDPYALSWLERIDKAVKR